MVHEKLSWRNCKCPVDLWQPGQIVLKKFHPSKNPVVKHIWLFMQWENMLGVLYLLQEIVKKQCFPVSFSSSFAKCSSISICSIIQDTYRNSISCLKIFLSSLYMYFIEICSQWSNWQYMYVSTDSDNGLAPNRQQAIIWTNGSLAYWYELLWWSTKYSSLLA